MRYPLYAPYATLTQMRGNVSDQTGKGGGGGYDFDNCGNCCIHSIVEPPLKKGNKQNARAEKNNF
jgi:hypothetical protein